MYCGFDAHPELHESPFLSSAYILEVLVLIKHTEVLLGTYSCQWSSQRLFRTKHKALRNAFLQGINSIQQMWKPTLKSGEGNTLLMLNMNKYMASVQ